MSEWKPTPLKALTKKIGSGATPKGGGESYKDFGISLIRSQNVLEIMFSKAGLAFIDEEQAYDLRSVTVEPLDVLLNITGDSVARCCIVPTYTLPARVNQHVCIIRADKSKLVPSFLMYALNYHKEDLLSLSEIGATRRALTKTMVEDFQINLPPFQEQERIAEVLSSLDDKIDLLHRQNQTLEQLAETMFRQWFVEEAEDSWEEGKLEDLCEIISSGGTPATKQSEYYGGDVNWYSTKELNDNFLFESLSKITEQGLQNSSAKLFPIGTVVIAIYAAPTVGRLGILATEAAFNQAACGLVADQKKCSKEFLYLFLKSQREELNQLATGSAQQNLNVGKIKNYPLLIPPKAVFDKLKSFAEPIFQKIQKNTRQVKQLEQTRDTLLPKLMSGAVRVVFS